MLGRAYALGRGVDADVEEAARHYVAAAEQGHALAAYEAGFAYLRARGVDHDLVQSYRWFAFAESAGVGDAGHWREQVLKKMSKKERAEAERLVAAP
jgi:TPR repeat protein